MSSKVSATYRIKIQIYLTLNEAFEKAAASRPGSTTRNPGLHRRPNPKCCEQGAKGLSKSRDRREPRRRGDGAGGLSRYRRFCFRWNFLLARSRDSRGGGSKGDRRVAGRLDAGARGFGRARHVDRHRRDPAARGGNQKRRRLSARFDRKGEQGSSRSVPC